MKKSELLLLRCLLSQLSRASRFLVTLSGEKPGVLFGYHSPTSGDWGPLTETRTLGVRCCTYAPYPALVGMCYKEMGHSKTLTNSNSLQKNFRSAVDTMAPAKGQAASIVPGRTRASVACTGCRQKRTKVCKTVQSFYWQGLIRAVCHRDWEKSVQLL